MSDSDNVEYVYEFEKKMEAPVYENQTAGCMKIMVNGEEFARFDIRIKESVKKIDFRYSILKIVQKFLL